MTILLILIHFYLHILILGSSFPFLRLVKQKGILPVQVIICVSCLVIVLFVLCFLALLLVQCSMNRYIYGMDFRV